jgi:hypothetical protein
MVLLIGECGRVDLELAAQCNTETIVSLREQPRSAAILPVRFPDDHNVAVGKAHDLGTALVVRLMGVDERGKVGNKIKRHGGTPARKRPNIRQVLLARNPPSRPLQGRLYRPP